MVGNYKLDLFMLACHEVISKAALTPFDFEKERDFERWAKACPPACRRSPFLRINCSEQKYTIKNVQEWNKKYTAAISDRDPSQLNATGMSDLLFGPI